MARLDYEELVSPDDEPLTEVDVRAYVRTAHGKVEHVRAYRRSQRLRRKRARLAKRLPKWPNQALLDHLETRLNQQDPRALDINAEIDKRNDPDLSAGRDQTLHYFGPLPHAGYEGAPEERAQLAHQQLYQHYKHSLPEMPDEMVLAYLDQAFEGNDPRLPEMAVTEARARAKMLPRKEALEYQLSVDAIGADHGQNYNLAPRDEVAKFAAFRSAIRYMGDMVDRDSYGHADVSTQRSLQRRDFSQGAQAFGREGWEDAVYLARRARGRNLTAHTGREVVQLYMKLRNEDEKRARRDAEAAGGRRRSR